MLIDKSTGDAMDDLRTTPGSASTEYTVDTYREELDRKTKDAVKQLAKSAVRHDYAQPTLNVALIALHWATSGLVPEKTTEGLLAAIKANRDKQYNIGELWIGKSGSRMVVLIKVGAKVYCYYPDELGRDVIVSVGEFDIDKYPNPEVAAHDFFTKEIETLTTKTMPRYTTLFRHY